MLLSLTRVYWSSHNFSWGYKTAGKRICSGDGSTPEIIEQLSTAIGTYYYHEFCLVILFRCTYYRVQIPAASR
jgi:hypothetical protein